MKVVENLIEAQNDKIELPLINTDNSLINPSSLTELTKIIRGYNMNICKQMKKKLLFTERRNFHVRLDKGSASREQVYIELNTANYEYLKHNLIGILKTKLNCTEDMSKRRIAKDLSETSEVEAQFSIQFTQNEGKYNVHITFYYTRCSIWIQGSSAKINNMTVAQFFTMHYIEKVSNMVVQTVPLDSVTEMLKERITSFLSPDETKSFLGNNRQIEEGICVSCSRKCLDNNKSIQCNLCKMKQHFHCAGIKVESERNMYLVGGMPFTCNKCFAEGGVILDDTSSSLVSPVVVENLINKSIEGTNPQLQVAVQTLDEDRRNEPIPQVDDTNKTKYSTGPNGEQGIATIRSGRKNDNCYVSQTIIERSNDQANHDKTTIRRLQNEISQLKADHLKTKEKYEVEVSTLKESLRQSIAECEREKETRVTLQHCVDAFRAANNDTSRSTMDISTPRAHSSSGIDNNNTRRNVRRCRFDDKPGGCTKAECTFHHDNPRNSQVNPTAPPRSSLSHQPNDTTNRRCRFFNRVGGCKYGSSCTFLHIQRPMCRKHPNCNNRRCTFFHPANFQMATRPREPPDARQTARSARSDQSIVNPVGNSSVLKGLGQNNYVQDQQPNKQFHQQWKQQQDSQPPNQPQPLMDIKPRIRSQLSPNVQYYTHPQPKMMQNSTMGMVQSPNVQPLYTSPQPLMMQNPVISMCQPPTIQQHPQQTMMEQSPTAPMPQFYSPQHCAKYQIEAFPSHVMFPGAPHQVAHHQLNRVMV